MGLRRDTIEPVEGDKRALGISRRPVMWIGGAFSVLGVLAFAVVSEEPHAEARETAKPEAQILVPDRTSGAELAAQHARSAPQQLRPANGLPAPPPPEDSLGVTSSVPLTIDGENAPPLARIDQVANARRALLAQDKLEQLREQLELRRAAYTETSDVEAFAAARRSRGQEAAAFLDGLKGPSDGQPEDQDVLGMGGESLRALSAMPAAALRMAANGRGPGGAAGGGDAMVDSDPSGQVAKHEFFRHGGDQLRPGELSSPVRRAGSPYRILMGWKIPGILQTPINSEGPGPISGFVREDVFDSATGKHLLIPRESQLVGTYSSVVAQGQRRVQVAWVRLNFPDGATLDLGSMPGTDQAGLAGFSHTVDTHWGQRLAGALLASIFAIGFEATMPTQRLSFESSLHRGVGESLSQWGIEEARRLGQQPPTLKIPAGYKFTIFATQDVTFPGPYRDEFVERRRR